MSRPSGKLINVSPPNFDRAGVEELQARLFPDCLPAGKQWLTQRLSEGLQLRVQTFPRQGYIQFAPGRASWLPIKDAGQAVVIETLRVAGGQSEPDFADDLLFAAEEWARYFGFSMLLTCMSAHSFCFPTDWIVDRGFQQIDETIDGTRLMARILQGPCRLPYFPQNWRQREVAQGSGVVIQTAKRCAARLKMALDLAARAEEIGLPVQLDLMDSAAEMRQRALRPGISFAVTFNGTLIATEPMSTFQIWQAIAGAGARSA